MVSLNMGVVYCIGMFCGLLGVISAYLIYHYVQEEKKVVEKMKLKHDLDIYEPAFIPEEGEKKKKKKKQDDDDGFEDDEEYDDDACDEDGQPLGVVAGGEDSARGRGRGGGRGRGRGRGAGRGQGEDGGGENAQNAFGGRVLMKGRARGGRRILPKGMQFPNEQGVGGGLPGAAVIGGAAVVGAAGGALAAKAAEKPSEEELRKKIYEDSESDPDADEPIGPHGMRPIRPSGMFLAQTRNGMIVNMSMPTEDKPKTKKKKPIAKLLRPVEKGEDFDNYRDIPSNPPLSSPAPAEYNVPTPNTLRDDRAQIRDNYLDRKGMNARVTINTGIDF